MYEGILMFTDYTVKYCASDAMIRDFGASYSAAKTIMSKSLNLASYRKYCANSK